MSRDPVVRAIARWSWCFVADPGGLRLWGSSRAELSALLDALSAAVRPGVVAIYRGRIEVPA